MEKEYYMTQKKILNMKVILSKEFKMEMVNFMKRKNYYIMVNLKTV